MITETQIKAAIRNAPTRSKKSITLTDDIGERGAGRLSLLVRPFKNRVCAEWYVGYYRSGKKITTKIASYPTLSLGEARKKFREEFAPAISTGGAPTGSRARNRGVASTGRVTVKELFEAYISDMRRSKRRSAGAVERILLTGNDAAVKSIGGDRPAAEIGAADIVPHLVKIYDRGSVAMAGKVRCYIGSAFAFGLASAHDYTRKTDGADWGIVVNPVLAIKSDSEAQRARNRFLSPLELRLFWEWLTKREERSMFAKALKLMLSLGQRTEEVLRIGHESSYSAEQKMLTWNSTKNKLPHAIPLCQQAVEILNALPVNRHGLYFPHKLKPSEPAPYDSVERLIGKFIEETGCEHFMPRDCRRSWKTLCGRAGVSKDMRDRLQNHSKSGDVSSKHYDRYEYADEKRAAMATWGAFLERILAGELDEQATADIIAIGRAA